MPVLYQPKPGSVVICDFTGMKVPEMVKTRPVVVLTKHRHNNMLVTVVPLSTTEPSVIGPHHHELSKNPLPDEPAKRVWAKCDMVYTLSIERMDRYKIRTRKGRTYVAIELPDDDFQTIKKCVAAALGVS